jgi:UPF0755 protein
MDIFEATPSIYKRRNNVRLIIGTLFFLAILVCGILFTTMLHLNTAPPSFPQEADVRIDEGKTLTEITHTLEATGVVRSSLYLYFVLHRAHGDAFIQAGTYRFPQPLTTREVAAAITQGEYRSPLITLTLPEGFRAADLPQFLPDTYVASSSENFETYEGYLFPETYFISSTMTYPELIALLQRTFDEKIAPYAPRIASSGFTTEEVIILASIIEREAKGVESKKMVSGILQNRLALDMPLQVDAVFDYLLHKTSAELTTADLEIDSPFNTYRNTGLPPAPIANPGLDAIEAVLDPTQSEYLYYLTAPDGTFHYAKTFEEHKKNKARYLK